MPGPSADKNRKRAVMKHRMGRRVDVVLTVVLLAVALAHLLRLLTGAEATIAGRVVPVWTSLLGCVGPAVLAGLLWWTRR